MKLEDRLKSLLAGLTVIAVANGLFGIKVENSFWTEHEWLRYLLGIGLSILFLLILLQDWLLRLYREKIMRNRNLSDIVVSKKMSVLDIRDNAGKRATYFQKTHFSNIKNGDYIVHLVSDPKIESSKIDIEHLQLANCSAKFDTVQKDLKLYFVDKIEGLNDLKSLYKVEKYFYFSVELVDCFTHQEADSWDVTTFNYIKEFELNINFPPGKEIEQLGIYRKDNGQEILLEAAAPILIKKGNSDSIYLLITNFDQRDKFIVKWIYKKS